MVESISDAVAFMWIGDEKGTATTLETIDDGYNNMLIKTSNVGAQEEKADFTAQRISLVQHSTAQNPTNGTSMMCAMGQGPPTCIGMYVYAHTRHDIDNAATDFPLERVSRKMTPAGRFQGRRRRARAFRVSHGSRIGRAAALAVLR